MRSVLVLPLPPKLVTVLATITTAAAASGLVIGGYHYAAMRPTSQIFGRTLLAGRSR